MPQALIAPVLIASTIAGVSLSAYSAISGSQSQRRMAEDQQRQEALRQQAMELDNRRRQLEVLRQQQRARATALSNATAQGAASGSGLQGGYGQIAGETNTNLLGLNQSLMLGRENFAIDQDITSARSSYATSSGLGSLGGTLIQSLGPIQRLSMGFGPSPYYGSSYSGNIGRPSNDLGGFY